MGHGHSRKSEFSNFDNPELEEKVTRAGQRLTILKALNNKKYGASAEAREAQESTERRRAELLNFVNSQKTGTQETYDHVNQMSEKQREASFRRRQTEAACLSPLMTANANSCQLEDDASCHLCGKEVRQFEFQPCRVCPKVFHFRCVEQSATYGPAEVDLMYKVANDVGWTCHDCSNICNVLYPEEVDRIFNLFERLDIDKDAMIDIDEYLRYTDRISIEVEGRSLTDEEKARHRAYFRRLDADGSGQVDWGEFLNHKACEMLQARKSALSSLLTPKEIKLACAVFSALDTDKDGLVYQSDLKNNYRTWYKYMDSLINVGHSHGKRRGSRRRSRIGSISLRPTVPNWLRRLSGASMGRRLSGVSNARRSQTYEQGLSGFEETSGRLTNREIDFEEYLEQQTLYIISSRPNITHS